MLFESVTEIYYIEYINHWSILTTYVYAFTIYYIFIFQKPKDSR